MSTKKPTLQDIANAAGVGVATVDRVVNARAPVTERTRKRVLEAAQKLGIPVETTPLRSGKMIEYDRKKVGIVFQHLDMPFYEHAAARLRDAAARCASMQGELEIVVADGLAVHEVAVALLRLSKRVDRIGVVAPDHPVIGQAIERLAEKGIQTYAYLTDQSSDKRAGYVGMDNRLVGRSAGWTVANLARRPGKVAILMGDHLLRSQQSAEGGFRSYFREYSDAFEVLEPSFSMDDAEHAYEVTRGLLYEHPDLAGIYINCGGMAGAIRALRESRRHQGLVTVCSELMEASRMALAEQVVKVVLAHPLDRLAEVLIDVLTANDAQLRAGIRHRLVPFSFYMSENI